MSRLNRKLQRMSRRRFLETFAALGVSASALNGMTQDAVGDLIDDPRREVPRVMCHMHTNHEEVKNGAAPERSPVYYKISRDQWRRVESAHNARKKIEKQLADRSEPTSVWVTTNSNGEKRIGVEIQDNGSWGRFAHYNVENAIPSSIDGVAGSGTEMETTVKDIPVTVERKKVEANGQPTSAKNRDDPALSLAQQDPDYPEDFYYADDWSPVPGGAAAVFFKYGAGAAAGTLATPVHNGDQQNMVTAGHNVLDGSSVLDTSVTDSTSDISTDFEVNDVRNDNGEPSVSNFDAALIGPAGDISMSYRMAAGSGWTGSGEIMGTLSRDRLRDIEDNGTISSETFIRRGARTGENKEFGIDDIDSEGFRPSLDENKTDGGDSGGPYYIKWETKLSSGDRTLTTDIDPADYPKNTMLYIAGVHHGNSKEYNTTVATSMYRIEKEFEVTV